MMEKLNVYGFTATCRCGQIIGALDYVRTDKKESGKLLGEWLHSGCTVTPQFTSMWSATIGTCKCGEPS